MHAGELTATERSVLRQLLAAKSITEYVVVGAVGEGKRLPGSSTPGEIESFSGMIVTRDTAYTFWLDWDGEHGSYTLGDADGSWAEMTGEEQHDYEVVEARTRLLSQGV